MLICKDFASGRKAEFWEGQHALIFEGDDPYNHCLGEGTEEGKESDLYEHP